MYHFLICLVIRMVMFTLLAYSGIRYWHTGGKIAFLVLALLIVKGVYDLIYYLMEEKPEFTINRVSQEGEKKTIFIMRHSDWKVQDK